MKLDHDDTEFAWRVAERLRRAPNPPVDDALLARIHATVAAGPRREPATRRVWPTLLLAIAAAVIVVALVFRPAQPLTAGAMSGTLRFDPATPRPGQTVRVRYEPNAVLSQFDHLRLRARFRTVYAIPGWWFATQMATARLDRDRAGAFTGTFVFPDSAVFGAFAVEDDDARHVDSNQRALWTLLAADSTGTPTFEALEQRINDVAMTNWELSLATAERATTVHPDQVRGWVILYTLQQSMLTRTGRDSALAAHRLRLPVLDKRFASAPISSDELGAMVSYAEMLRDTVRASRWRERLVRSNPTGVWGINKAMDPGLIQMRSNPRGALVFFDSLWRAAGGLHPGIAPFGLTSAQLATDSGAAMLWAQRALEGGRADTIQVAAMMLRSPGLVDEAMRLLRSELRATAGDRDQRRPLELSRAAARLVEEDRRVYVLTLLADALAARGDKRESADTLALAASIGWNPTLYRKLASAALSLGDTARAINALARAAADPMRGPSLADSAPSLIGRRFVARDWESARQQGRSEMRRRILARAERTSLPAAVTLWDSGGRQRRLSDLVGGRPTLVAFWSTRCANSVAQHPTLAATARQLEALGYNTVAVTDEPLDSAMRATLAERGWDFPAYRDVNREARLALAQWGTPNYFVLDGQGRVRFRLTTLESAAAQLASVDE